MKESFFYQERGKTQGPLTADELRARIRDGRIRLFDLIYKEGDAGWRMALEHPDLRDDFKASDKKSFKGRPWVCLRRKSDEGFDFVTAGPYSDEEISEALRSGSFSYNDYVWKTGFPEWKRIGALPEFNRRLAEREPEAKGQSPEPPGKELLKNVIEMRRSRGPTEEPPPAEADPDDLTKVLNARDGDTAPMKPPSLPSDEKTKVISAKSAADEKTKIIAKKSAADEKTKIVSRKAAADEKTVLMKTTPPAPPPPAVPSRESDQATAEVPILESRKKKKKRRAHFWADWGIVIGLAAILLGCVMYLAWYIRLDSKAPPTLLAVQPEEPAPKLTPAPPLPSSAPPSVSSAQSLNSGEPEEVWAATEILNEEQVGGKKSRPIKPEAPLPRVPTQLSLTVQGGSSRVEVRSNGTAEFPVFLQVIGAAGQVANGGAFYRYLKLTPVGDMSHALDLNGLKLPSGHFTLRAETANLKKEAVLHVGVTDSDYRASVARQRKIYAAAIWSERLTLFRLARNLERSLQQALAEKRWRSRGFEALQAVSKGNGASYLLFEDWWELKKIVLEAKEGVDQSLVDRARRARERLATFSVWRK